MIKIKSHRLGVIAKSDVIHLLKIAICSLFMFVLYDHSLMKAFPVHLYEYLMLFMGLFFCTLYSRKRKSSLLFWMTLLFCILSAVYRFESSLIGELSLILSLAVFYTFGEELYDDLSIGALISFIPYLYIYIRNVFFWRYAPTNHAALAIAFCGMLLITLLYRRRASFKLLLLCEVALIVFSIPFGSRTSLVSLAAGAALMVWFYLKSQDKSPYSGLWVLLGTIILIAGIFTYYDRIYSILFLKWGHHRYEGSGNILFQTIKASSRMAMWEDVFEHISIFGFGPNYIRERFGYDNIHNAYIQSYVSFGIIAAFFYCAWIIKSIARGFKHRGKVEIQSYLLILVPMVILGMLESNFILDPEYQYLGLFVVIICGQINVNNHLVTE